MTKGSRSEYDICLSFAGESRSYVEAVAEDLRNRGISVFYDEWEKARLWGKDLYQEFSRIYRDSARYCVVFVSAAYARKVWPSHELRNAQARALVENAEYILPARFDNTKLPGLLDTVLYIDLTKTSPKQLSRLVASKLGAKARSDFLPPRPDLLFRRLRATSAKARGDVFAKAQDLFDAWLHCKPKERRLLAELVVNGCSGELPDLIHCSLERLARYSDLSKASIRKILPLLSDFGIELRIRRFKADGAARDDVTFRYRILDVRHFEPETEFAFHMIIGATRGFCANHGIEALVRADFGQLASVNKGEGPHALS